jgi:hypothetical protein
MRREEAKDAKETRRRLTTEDTESTEKSRRSFQRQEQQEYDKTARSLDNTRSDPFFLCGFLCALCGSFFYLFVSGYLRVLPFFAAEFFPSWQQISGVTRITQ